MVSGIAVSNSTEGDWHFSFLGRSKHFERGNVDWTCVDMPKLWRYNLHYFDYLHDPQRSFEEKGVLVEDWVKKNPQETEDAWEPYTVSLRIVNWIKFFLSINTTCDKDKNEDLPKREWLESLLQQALWLEHNIEYHILANHYLKNGIAMFFAGAYFHGVDADRWLKKGVQILREELDEQFLADGGHFERSPMYHSICVTDYLDVLNLARHSQGVLSPEDQGTFAQRMTRSLDFLSDMCLPDNEIALFNDSAFGIAISPQQIFDYAKKVMRYESPVRPSGLSIHSYAPSGYYVCRNAEDKIIIDCGPIGPDYQPGHAHCDTLSYELAIDGRRVVVDSGVFDYEPSQERAYARSTRAHNTVIVDGEEQSEIWGVFRVARRARPLYAHVQANAHELVLFEGAHDGYMRLSGSPIHKRRVSYDDGEPSWIITDMLEGTGIHRMESFVHIHPDFTLVESGSNSFKIERCGEAIATVQALSVCQTAITEGCYFPEFGLSQKNLVLAFSCHGEVPLQLSYRIQKTNDRQGQAHRHANSLPITLFPSRGECTCDQNI
ncbi:MAG: heparinase II/III family protein [Nitrospira sp.]|nr:heparinase II/III family protein [Nitrospira sp.]